MKRSRDFARAPLAALVLVILSTAALRAQQNAAPAAPPSPVIARIEGRPITQEDFDRVAIPYFDRLRSEMKQGFNDEVKKLASHNVLDELIRRELLIVEARREKLPVSEAETDRILRQDPFFYAAGKFDQTKFVQYKLSPGTNYLQVLPRIRELASAGKMDSIVRLRIAPAPAAVRAEWAKRNDQVRFKFLPLSIRDVSLEPESSEQDWATYYEAHHDQFERKPRVRLRYLMLPIPPAGDPARDSSAALAMARARGLVDSLQKGASIDTLALALNGAQDTGLIDLPPSMIPGLGPVPEFAVQLAHADSDTTVRVVGPGMAPEAVVVGVVTERHSKSLPPLADVLADVKRRADVEKRRTANEAEKRAFYESHRDQWRSARARVTRIHLDESAAPVKAPSPKDLERWYAERGRAWLALPDSLPLPKLEAGRRDSVRERWMAEQRSTAALRVLQPLADGWRAGRDPRMLARTARAEAETLSLARGAFSDSIFPPGVVDSLFLAGAGRIEGPRRLGTRAVVWRVDAVDTNLVPSFEEAGARIEREFVVQKRQEEEADGRTWYEAHRADYRTKPKFVVDYVRVRIPTPDSIKISEAEARRSYEKNRDTYRQEEEVHARHILIGTRPGQLSDAKGLARADSIHDALVGGADFAALARLYSDDPSSKSTGGDVGFFARGRMVQEFTDTSFALPVGRVSQPVKTIYGYHVIRVDEKKPAGVKPFAEVRAEIERQLAQTRGDSLALRSAESLRRRLLKGESAAVVAAREGGVATSAPFTANEPVPGVGSIPALAQQLDSLKVGRWAAKPLKSPDAYVLLRMKEKLPAGPAGFDEVRFQASEDAKTAKKKELLATKASAIRARLAAHDSLEVVARPFGGLKDSGPLTQSSMFVPFLGAEPRLVTKAFAMKPGQVSDSLATAQGFAWIRIEEKKTVEGSSFAKDRPAITQELSQKKYDDWLTGKKKSVRIEILRADLREKPKPITQTFTVGR